MGSMESRTGGELVAESLVREGVEHLFCLHGGHIDPILRAAHEALIPPPDLPRGDCFGETWQQWVAQS